MNEDITLTSQGIAVIFQWTGDRYTHRFASNEEAMASCEDPSMETPVFTDAHRQGDLLFLSGMSGDRHWSMSIEPAATGLVMDVACRVKSAIERIGSLYERSDKITASTELINNEPSSEITSHEGGHLAIMPTRVPSGTPMTLRYRFRIESY